MDGGFQVSGGGMGGGRGLILGRGVISRMEEEEKRVAAVGAQYPCFCIVAWAPKRASHIKFEGGGRAVKGVCRHGLGGETHKRVRIHGLGGETGLPYQI